MSNSVRGYSAYSRPASIPMEVAGFVTDLGCSFCLLFAGLKLFRFSPVPHWSWIPALATIFLVLNGGLKTFTRRTLGERAWSLRPLPVDAEGRKWKLFQAPIYRPFEWAKGIFLTLLPWFAAVQVLLSSYAGNPLWLESEVWKLQPFMPSSGKSAEGVTWGILPYYYSLGAWPGTFSGSPVSYALPYKKGPPQVFIEEITANWLNPEIKMTFEGPKTPDHHRIDPGSQAARARLRRCLEPSWSSPLLDWGCMKVREHALTRHVAEMNKFQPETWTLRWFTVDNPALPLAEQAQGFYLRAESSARFQSRFVIVTPNGTHQAFILNALRNGEGAAAEALLHQAIGSLRISADLNPGRAWIDRQLQGIDLGKLLAAPSDEGAARKLLEVQSILLSKLSVDPSSFESFYHLAGNALLVLKLAIQTNQNDLSAASKPLVFSAYRYAQDVAPNDPRLPKLQQIWLESKKY